MSKIKPNALRRREIRKNIPKRDMSLRSWLSRSQVLWGIFYLVIFVGTASWLEWERSLEPAMGVGHVVEKSHVARVSFTSNNLQATEQLREGARAKASAVYVANVLWFETLENLLAKLPEIAASVSEADQIPDDSLAVGLNEDALAGLRVYHTEEGVSEGWVELVGKFVFDLRREAILETDRYLAEKENLAPTIKLQVGDELSKLVYEDNLLNVGDLDQMEGLVEKLGGGFGAGVRMSLLGYLTGEETGGANYVLDVDATTEAKEGAAGRVDPIITSFESGQMMVGAGEPLDEDRYRLLRAENSAYLEWLSAEGRQSMGVLHRVGGVLLIGMVALGLVVCVVALRPRVAENPMRGLALCALLLGALAMSQSLSLYSSTVGSVGMAMLVVVILTIAYDQRFALAVGGLEIMLIGLLLHLSIGSVMVMLAACFVAAMQLREVRQRGALIRMGFVTGLVVAVGVGAAGYWELQLVEGVGVRIMYEAWYGFLTSMAVGFFVLGVLPYIEKVFKVTTSMTLVELCDVNQPLLRRLQQVAPGTYNHSLLVGTLAEAAAEAIGADSLLTRVGAYYHDIGKMHKPQYFVENQAGGTNLHDKLSPAMSLLIIVGHVKDGIEMAREFGLPSVLHHFIESHHGTTLVEYFYHAAMKKQTEDERPEEVEFRYPGPKPETKEGAILMLCDATESASRTLNEPTAPRIEALVHKLASKRLMDGQFDRCELTLAELKKVEDAIVKSLCALHHGRVAYPSDRGGEEEGDGDARAVVSRAAV